MNRRDRQRQRMYRQFNLSPFKVGDKVRNKYNGQVGEVAFIPKGELSDCVIVRFNPISDGYAIPKVQLEPVQTEGGTK